MTEVTGVPARSRVAAVAMLALATGVFAGCGTASSNGSLSPSAGVSRSPSPAPTPAWKLALIAATSSSPPGLYDVHNPSAPTLIKSLSGIGEPGSAARPKFLSASTISYVSIPNFTPSTSFTAYDSRLMLSDLQKGDSRTVAQATGNVWDFAWSRDQRVLAYELQTAAGWQLWLKRQDVQPVPLTGVLPNVRFEGRPGDGVWVTFSPSGTYLALANTFAAGAHLQVFLVSDGSKVWSTAKGGSLFWARQADRLYFEDSTGEHAWDPPAKVTGVVPDGWVDPSLSPDGCCVAYSQEDSQYVPHVEVYQWQSAGVSKLPSSVGAYPHFVAAGILWLLPTMPSGVGGPAPPYQPTGAVNAYDLRSQKATLVSLSGQPGDAPTVFDIWPR